MVSFWVINLYFEVYFLSLQNLDNLFQRKANLRKAFLYKDPDARTRTFGKADPDPAGSFSGPNSSGSSPCELYDSRAVIPVNPKLNEHLNALDIHMLVEGKGRSQITLQIY